MMARSTCSNQRPDTLVQDQIRQINEPSCDARPDHTLGQIRSFGDVGSMSGLPESGHGWRLLSSRPNSSCAPPVYSPDGPCPHQARGCPRIHVDSQVAVALHGLPGPPGNDGDGALSRYSPAPAPAASRARSAFCFASRSSPVCWSTTLIPQRIFRCWPQQFRSRLVRLAQMVFRLSDCRPITA